jgi:hypothetical protein
MQSCARHEAEAPRAQSSSGMNMYDTTKPRYTVMSISSPNRGDFETLSISEALFWKSLGYIVMKYEWKDGQFQFTGEI